MKFSKSIIKIKDIADIAGTSDTRTIIRWLDKYGVDYKKMGREYIIDEWSLNFQMQLDSAKKLKVQYPVKWAEIFQFRCNDDSIVKAVFQIYKPTEIKTQIKRNKNEKHFR